VAKELRTARADNEKRKVDVEEYAKSWGEKAMKLMAAEAKIATLRSAADDLILAFGPGGGY
jgi:hypothetical protein